MAITLRSDFDVELVQAVGSDEFICKTARVSTLGAASIDSEESTGLIWYLLRKKHGSPFEHGQMTFRISAPIFVWREYMRHRIGFSYNEESGRYKILEGVFYMPPRDRNLVQIGKPGEYRYEPGTDIQYNVARSALFDSYQQQWMSYQRLLKADIAKEVARMALGVSIYSSAYVTLNPRSMMNFLALRTKDERAAHPSDPMFEINKVATYMEETFAELYPKTYAAFNRAKRVAP